jgi:ABC-type multidrug transport system ATPase subunit
MIELHGLAKTYGARTILSGASLTVRAGESMALVGANGSGKTTTLRCAVGLARVAAGHVLIDGIDMAARPCDARARLSYLAQRTEFPATLTVREILTVVADLRGAPARNVEREIALCGLSHAAARTAGQLSGGERQRIAIAAMFIPDVAAYLLDEPSTSLDPIGIRLLVDRLTAARDSGCAVLFTTHTAGELEELATSIATLRGGRIITVAHEVEPRERHISIVVGGKSDEWVGVSIRGGARRAWMGRGRLHAIVPDEAVGDLLLRLDDEGACVSGYRSESPLTAALDQLHKEDSHVEAACLRSVDRCVAADRLWRGSAWARADSAGPR